MDANGTVLKTQAGLSTFEYNIANFVAYPLSVSIEAGGCDAHIEVFASNSPNNGYDCSTLDFTFAFTDAVDMNSVAFTIPANTPQLNWDFGPSSTAYISPPTGSTPETFVKYFNDDGTTSHYVCATVKTENCTNTVCKDIGTTGCGIHTFKKRKAEKFGGGTRKYIAKLVLKDPLLTLPKLVLKIEHYEVLLSDGTTRKKKADVINVYMHSFEEGRYSFHWNTIGANNGCVPNKGVVYKFCTKTCKVKKKVKHLPKDVRMRKEDIKAEFYIVNGFDFQFL